LLVRGAILAACGQEAQASLEGAGGALLGGLAKLL